MPGALSWFQKYQKSLMLVLLAPALIGMGITGAILSVVSDPGEMTVGEVFGEPVTQTQYLEIVETYKNLSRTDDDEQGWRFLAMWLAARRSGLHVSDAEVGKSILDQAKYMIAQNRALEEVAKLNLQYGSDAFEQAFRERFISYVLDEDFTFEAGEYENFVRNRQGMPVRAYENHQRREALVQRYLETLRDLAVVSPAAVREAYDEKYHRRVLELIELAADAYAPQADAAEGTPGHVTEEQVQAYYERRAADFDVPRRVELAWIAAPLAKVKASLELPDDAELEAYNRREGVVPVSSFSEGRVEVIDAWRKDATRERAAALLDAVADRVERAELEKQTPDLAAIVAEVERELKTDVLEHGTSGLLERDGLADTPVAGLAAQYWFDSSNTVGDTSDPLANDEAWFVLQTKAVEQQRTPEYETIAAQVRDAYINGSPAELEDQYEQYKGTRYRQANAFTIEAVYVKDEAFGGDRQRAHDALKQALDAAKDKERRGDREFSLFWFQTATPEEIPTAVQDALELLESAKLSADELNGHELLGTASGEVNTRVKRGFSDYPIRSQDDTAWYGYRVLNRVIGETKPFDAVVNEVREAIRRARATERAELAAEERLETLAGKRDAELDEALEAQGLEVRRTEPFDRDATSLEGIPDAGRLVAEAFSAEAEVGGPFTQVVPDIEGGRVFLIRVAEKQPAPDDKWAEEYATLRKDLLSKARIDFTEAQLDQLYLRAKGIEAEHLAFAEQHLDGPGGVSKVTLRQVFLPPDREITEGWLEAQARARIDEAKGKLAQGSAWAAVVDKYSEDDATRGRAGELPALSREELANEFGVAFAEAAFALPLAQGEGGAAGPIVSRRGFHLVRKTSERGGKAVFQHVLVSTDPAIRRLPDDVRQRAEEAARKQLEQAQADLQAGKAFGVVARQYGDPLDPHGQGSTFEVQYVTALEREALAQPLEWEPSEEVLAGDPAWIPEAVKVELSTGPVWQLYACERDPADQASLWDQSATLRNRLVYHIQTASPERMESVRDELASWMRKEVARDGRPSFQQVLRKFHDVAADRSEAPTKGKQGALGRLTLLDSVRGYGLEFIDAVFRGEVKPGTRTGIFRSAKGYHLVEVVDVTAQQPEERRREVGRLLLAGTEWRVND